MSNHSLLSQLQRINCATNTAAFKACIRNSYEWLQTEYHGADNVVSLVEGRAAFVDALLCHIWRLFELDQHSLSLLAVGGYGRGHLQPYSDIDLLLLSNTSLSQTQQALVQQFITLLWDIGLDVGQSVRTIDQTLALAKDDITIATSLIESRLLTGANEHFAALQQQVHSNDFWSSKAFFIAKFAEQQMRHSKFHDTAYNLEPNVKENPGCLRDIQMIGWVAKKHFRVATGKELIAAGYFTQDELNELRECRKQLWNIRFTLHLHTKRNENRLLFDYQADVARKLGYFGSDGATCASESEKTAVEKMMREFFRVIRRVRELNEMLLQHFTQDILGSSVKHTLAINPDFELRDNLIYPTHAEVFRSPADILAFFKLLTNTPEVQGLHSATLRILRNARRQFATQYFCEDQQCRALFMELVKDARFFGLPWDLMHKHGIMQAYLPQWDHIVGMMQFDLFHAYTVDEHTHRLIKQLQQFKDPHKNTHFPRCGRIMGNMEQPHIIFLAGVFHDIAKGMGGDHSKLGAQCVLDFADQHQLAETDTRLIAWLVEHHLLLSVVAQRRDIHDPLVVQEFASTMGNQQKLDHLYVLTLADIRATNDNLWNDWKSSLMRELYLLTSKALIHGPRDTAHSTLGVEEHRQQTLQLLGSEHYFAAQGGALDDSTKADIASLWSEFPADYFARFKPAQIAWHTYVIINHLRSPTTCEQPLVAAVSGTLKAGTEMIVFCRDKPALFAQTASVLDSRNCSIHDAQICALNNGFIFDSFIILEQDGQQIRSDSRRTSLVETVRAQLNKPGVEHNNHRRMPRQLKQLNVLTKVRFFSNQADATMLELEALDSPGLLAKLGYLFVKQALTLKVAKITTIGERAEDLFIITNRDGTALSNSQQVALKQAIIELLN